MQIAEDVQLTQLQQIDVCSGLQPLVNERLREYRQHSGLHTGQCDSSKQPVDMASNPHAAV